MAVVVPLDSRQASITRLLLTETEPATVDAIASELKLTSRVVRYNLPSIETFLRPEGLQVVRRRGVGVWVSGDSERRRAILTSLGTAAGPRVLDGDDRKLEVLAALLDAAHRPVHIGDLERELGASRPTVRRDVRAAEAWLEGHHLHLQRLPGVGTVCGEMAGDPEAALMLVGLGVRVLSVSPASIAAVKRAVRAAVKSDLEPVALASLGESSAADVRRRLRSVAAGG